MKLRASGCRFASTCGGGTLTEEEVFFCGNIFPPLSRERS